MSEPGPCAPPVVCLMGPTGAGKSAAAMQLAQAFGGEIVNVDSAQVYRGMDIGTAKASPLERRVIPHHLLDLVDPVDTYSAARFRTDALRCLNEIRARGRLPLLVGGTGLYLRALQQGLARLPAVDPGLREGLRAELEGVGSAVLHARLEAVDPVAAQRIHPHDPQRILRALEVQAQTGRPFSAWLAAHDAQPLPFPLVVWILAPASRAALHVRLADRFQAMLDRGFVNEVHALRARADLTAETPALRAVGYRAVWRYLDGNISFPLMVEQAVTATRQLAKRQYTWFRGVAEARWWDADDPQLAARLGVALKNLM